MIDSRKKVEVLRRELLAMEDTLKQQEATQEPNQVVTDNFVNNKDNYVRTKAQIANMDTTVSYLADALVKRKQGFLAIRQTCCHLVNNNFVTQLDARKYIGRLLFNHNDKTMHIQVNPNNQESSAGLDVDRDIRNLSGGEKSYSSVSLILALWQRMTPPFRVLDEFDVFMDTVNRKIAISNILNFARLYRKDQFIFLTPLGTDNIDRRDDVKIIQLEKLTN